MTIRGTPATLAVTTRHVRRGDQRIFSARHVAADRIHRDVLVPEHDARQGLHLDVPQRLLLRVREVAHLLLGEVDVVEVAAREFRQRGLDLAVGEPEVLAVPAVELRSIVRALPRRRARRCREDALDGRAHLGVVGRDCICIAALLEELDHLRLPRGLSRAIYLIACGLIGDPAAPGRCSGGAVKKNS